MEQPLKLLQARKKKTQINFLKMTQALTTQLMLMEITCTECTKVTTTTNGAKPEVETRVSTSPTEMLETMP